MHADASDDIDSARAELAKAELAKAELAKAELAKAELAKPTLRPILPYVAINKDAFPSNPAHAAGCTKSSSLPRI